MQKVVLTTSLILIVLSQCFAQLADLDRFAVKAKSKIQVGMTPDEVKQVVGRPQAVEGGFSNSDESIIAGMPEEIGQMNNSTWFYFYPDLSLKVAEPEKILYFVNGLKVPQNIFGIHSKLDTVYIYKRGVVSPESGKSYSQLVYTVNGIEVNDYIFDQYLGVDSVYILVNGVVSPDRGREQQSLGDENLRIVQKEIEHTRVQRVFDKNLKVVQKDRKKTFMRTVQAREVTKQFMPILAVIFDKGIQVVAATKAFFKLTTD